MNPACNKQGVYAVRCSATDIVMEGVADCKDPRAVLAGIERDVVGAGRRLSVPPNKAAKRFVSTGQHTWALHEFAFGVMLTKSPFAQTIGNPRSTARCRVGSYDGNLSFSVPLSRMNSAASISSTVPNPMPRKRIVLTPLEDDTTTSEFAIEVVLSVADCLPDLLARCGDHVK